MTAAAAQTASPDRRVAAWALGDETGSSSRALARFMLDLPSDGFDSYPSDGSDLGRCIGLLDAVPEFRARLSEASAMSPMWAALVAHWDELEGMWRASDRGRSDALYNRMKAILRPIEDASGRHIRLGEGATMVFPKARA